MINKIIIAIESIICLILFLTVEIEDACIAIFLMSSLNVLAGALYTYWIH